ncbi:hypothetical protein EDD17DRAFT_1673334, partial [Pisolithus thermaeus]
RSQRKFSPTTHLLGTLFRAFPCPVCFFDLRFGWSMLSVILMIRAPYAIAFIYLPLAMMGVGFLHGGV